MQMNMSKAKSSTPNYSSMKSTTHNQTSISIHLQQMKQTNINQKYSFITIYKFGR